MIALPHQSLAQNLLKENGHEQITDDRKILYSDPANPGDGWHSGNLAMGDSESLPLPHVAEPGESATSGQTGKACKRNGNCWKLDTPLKASRNRWLLRLRSCRACGRKINPVSYMTNEQLEELKNDKKQFAEFKQQIENASNSSTVWRGFKL